MNSERSDGLVFTSDNGDEVVFNYFSWVEIIKGIIAEYAEATPEEAAELVVNSSITNTCPTRFIDVFTLSHELEYNWAMLIAYGQMYWLKGVSVGLPEGYVDWERTYREENGLAEESFVWLTALPSTSSHSAQARA